MNQREIKFRIWDKQFNKFLYQLPEKHHLDWERFDIQQFTGLLDKQGKEIFEGDIIDWENRKQIKKGISQIAYKYQIIFEEGSFIGVGDKRIGSKVKLDKDFLSSFEVIGNIYENPELLTPNL